MAPLPLLLLEATCLLAILLGALVAVVGGQWALGGLWMLVGIACGGFFWTIRSDWP